MRTYTESAGGHLSGYVNMSGITGKENSGWIPDRMPEDTVSFYHSKIGQERKRELEAKLRMGEVRILACTDAVGMVSSS